MQEIGQITKGYLEPDEPIGRQTELQEYSPESYDQEELQRRLATPGILQEDYRNHGTRIVSTAGV